jgi:hypothetical protein
MSVVWDKKEYIYIDPMPARTIHVRFQNIDEIASSAVHLPKMGNAERAYEPHLIASKGADDGETFSNKLYLGMPFNRVARMSGEGSTCYNGNAWT